MSKSNLNKAGRGYVRTIYPKKLLFALLIIFTAALCVSGPVALPIGKAPITLSILVIVTAGYLLGPLWGLIPVASYIILGAVGVPIFSGGVGSISILFGPTGGYIFGWLLVVILTGLFANRFRNPILQFVGVLVGELAFYITGVIWYMAVSKAILLIAILFGVLSFLVSNLIQGIVGLLIGYVLKRFLLKSQIQKG